MQSQNQTLKKRPQICKMEVNHKRLIKKESVNKNLLQNKKTAYNNKNLPI